MGQNLVRLPKIGCSGRHRVNRQSVVQELDISTTKIAAAADNTSTWNVLSLLAQIPNSQVNFNVQLPE